MPQSTAVKVATTTASALDGRKVHYAKPGRFVGAVTLCNGRTLAYALTGAPAVDCARCLEQAAAGKIDTTALEAEEVAVCEWFALCPNEAAGTVAHPVLGAVPTCQSCADKLDLTVEAVR